MSETEKDLLARIRAAKAALHTADGELGAVLAKETTAPRAQKRIIGQVVGEAFAKLRAAGEDLARLEQLLADEEG